MLKIFRSKSRREHSAYQSHQQESLRIARHLAGICEAELQLEKEMLEKLGEEGFAVWKRQRAEEKRQAGLAAERAETEEENRLLAEEQAQPDRWTQWARAFCSLFKMFGVS